MFMKFRTGVPQVVLPAWQDCYENAAHAEWLGVGIYANKKCAPHVDRDALAKDIVTLLQTQSFTQKAQALTGRIGKSEGRVEAAKYLVDIAQGKMKLEDYLGDQPRLVKSEDSSKLSKLRLENGKTLTFVESIEPHQFA